MKTNLKKGILYLYVASILLLVMFHRIIVVIKRPRKNGAAILQARAIHDGMSGSSWFGSPPLPYADFKQHIDDWENAEVAVKKRVPGAKQDRDEKKAIVYKDEDGYKAYVQGVCDANPDEAEEIAHIAMMSTKTITHPQKDNFAAVSKAAGESELISKLKAKRCAHEWKYSYTPDDPASWVYITTTLQGNTVVTGLKPASRVSFMHRTILPDGPTDWDQMVTITIL